MMGEEDMNDTFEAPQEDIVITQGTCAYNSIMRQIRRTVSNKFIEDYGVEEAISALVNRGADVYQQSGRYFRPNDLESYADDYPEPEDHWVVKKENQWLTKLYKELGYERLQQILASVERWIADWRACEREFLHTVDHIQELRKIPFQDPVATHRLLNFLHVIEVNLVNSSTRGSTRFDQDAREKIDSELQAYSRCGLNGILHMAMLALRNCFYSPRKQGEVWSKEHKFIPSENRKKLFGTLAECLLSVLDSSGEPMDSFTKDTFDKKLKAAIEEVSKGKLQNATKQAVELCAKFAGLGKDAITTRVVRNRSYKDYENRMKTVRAMLLSPD